MVRVLDGSGALLTPCTKERAQEEVRYGNAFWVNERTIRLRFSAMSKKKYRETVLRRDSGRCVWCGAPATTMDHIIPESKGGRFHPKNLMCACLACNQERKNMDIPEFLAHCEATGQTVRRKHILALYREAVRFQYHGENSNERNR
ncbi:HNH endonuclease [Alicyclobacillus tolerans]|uniref:HNH endonuclease n=1 Tax=Alicyclobacillus tolerans TaxID=90970 RepID=A0A1M6U0Y6_9BACL|nr:HNH endonuclease [Alicyclobacillus montanus]